MVFGQKVDGKYLGLNLRTQGRSKKSHNFLGENFSKKIFSSHSFFIENFGRKVNTMGIYATRAVSSTEYKDIISNIRNGYVDHHGIPHKPNSQVADILVLEANLGCRIGDIIALRHTDFVCDNGIWKLDITEEKTGKKRTFIIPKPVKDFIDTIHYGEGDRLFTLSKQAIWKHMRIISEYLGLDRTSTHSLRKFCAQNLYSMGSRGHPEP